MLNAFMYGTPRGSSPPGAALGIPSLMNLGRGSWLIKVPCIDSQNILSWKGHMRVTKLQLLDLQGTTPGTTPCVWEHYGYLCNYASFMQLFLWKGRSSEVQEQRNISNSGNMYNILLQTAYRDQTLYSLGMLTNLTGHTQVGQSWLHRSVVPQQCTAAISEAEALVIPPLQRVSLSLLWAQPVWPPKYSVLALGSKAVPVQVSTPQEAKRHQCRWAPLTPHVASKHGGQLGPWSVWHLRAIVFSWPIIFIFSLENRCLSYRIVWWGW